MMSDQDPAGAPSGTSGEDPLVSPVAEPATDDDSTGAGYDAATDAPADDAPARAAPAPAADPVVQDTPAPFSDRSRMDSHNMLPPRVRRRSGAERLLVRLIATAGIVAIGVAIAAIMVSSNSQGWLVGLVVSIVSVGLAAILWSSRQL
jgi:hypothetical protein